MSEPILGEIRAFAGNFAPYPNWLPCDGRLLPIQQYSALFSIIGATYGGDGKATFALPDLRGRGAIGMGQGPGLSNRAWGEKSGTETVTLTSGQIPAHIHPLTGGTAAIPGSPASANNGDQPSPIGNIPAVTQTAEASTCASYVVPSRATGTLANGTTAQLAGNTAPNAGGGQAHPNMQPYLAITYIIAISGIYPSRG
jgi:microcystin-dependent protein